MDSKQHWETTYATKSTTQVSWYQAVPTVSLELIAKANLDRGASIIDVGAGASSLVDELVKRDYRVTVLDLSAQALSVVRTRLGDHADRVRFLEADVTTVALPSGEFDLWHDRAVFHFLTTAEQRAGYLRTLHHALRPRGYALIATFDSDGPQRCSGLDVVRYSPQTLQQELGEHFVLVDERRELHKTPAGGEQRFQYSLFRVATITGS